MNQLGQTDRGQGRFLVPVTSSTRWINCSTVSRRRSAAMTTLESRISPTPVG